MNNKSRTINVIRNALSGIAVQGGIIVLNFCVRLIFVRCLSQEYLGMNGLFTNILTILALAELGVGNAITYSLYKPVAEANYVGIVALLNFYRKSYFAIGVVIGVLGLGLIPFLPMLIREYPSVPNVTIIYILYLFNTVASYFFSHMRSIFTADQRESILSQYRFLFAVIKSIGQCVVLVLTKNFILFLTVQFLCTVAENVFVFICARKIYPFLSKYPNAALSRTEVSDIVANVKSLMIYKIGSTALDGTDNIILSIYAGLSWIGKLSNYTLISGSVSLVTSQIMSAMTASVGNYIATENESQHEELLYKILLLSFLLYGFSFVCIACLATPFVQMIFGTEYALDYPSVFVLSLNFYIFGMMNVIWTFRSTMGLFIYGKYRPLVSAVINIIVSVYLVKLIGPIGVLLGTTITRVVTNVWFDPYIVFKYGLKKKPIRYYYIWLQYLVITIVTIGIIQSISMLLGTVSAIFSFFMRCLLCIVVFGLMFILTQSRTKEFRFLKSLGIQLVLNLRK